jgi:hypothetical protein
MASSILCTRKIRHPLSSKANVAAMVPASLLEVLVSDIKGFKKDFRE